VLGSAFDASAVNAFGFQGAEMRRLSKFVHDLHPYVLASIAGGLTVAQIVLAFVLHEPGNEVLEWAGWICLWTAGLFGILPIITLTRKGNVPKGESYVHTTVLVDTGIYGIVRHPQGGVAALLINLGVMLIVRHWLIILLGLFAMALFYVDTFKEDRACIDKFGDDYRRYIQRVPRVNFVTGVIRQVGRRAAHE
jgi:protein-S-isoprenylcysteine O-methyltransferase Ste14